MGEYKLWKINIASFKLPSKSNFSINTNKIDVNKKTC